MIKKVKEAIQLIQVLVAQTVLGKSGTCEREINLLLWNWKGKEVAL